MQTSIQIPIDLKFAYKWNPIQINPNAILRYCTICVGFLNTIQVSIENKIPQILEWNGET